VRNCVVIVLCLSCLLPLAGQDVSKPTVSSEPLTTDQIAVYRVVLKDFRKSDQSLLNVAAETELQDISRFSSQQCMEGVAPEVPAGIVHRIGDSSLLGSKIALVDRDEQQQQVDKNDPQNLMKRAIDDHEKVSDQQIDKSVKRAFESGLFTLSEIAFDKTHRHAIVTYSFVCGGLCGSGRTLVLRRVGQNWKVSRTCGGWVS